MRPILIRAFLPRLAGGLAAIALAALPFSAEANTAVRNIMRSWRHDMRAASPMLSGRAALDQAAIRTMLAAYVSDSTRISAAITGGSADARDIKQRFVTFGADAQAAMQTMGQANTLRTSFRRIDDDCQSCHDKYKD